MTNTLSESKILYYHDAVEKAAKIASGETNFLEPDDIIQELWIWLMMYGDKYIVKEQERAYNSNRPLPNIQGLLVLQARRTCKKELDDYRVFQGDFLYQSSDVKRILSNEMEIVEFYDEDQDAMTMGDIEGRLDVQISLNKLEVVNKNQHGKVVRYYIRGDDTLTEAEKRTAQRGLRALTDLINDSLRRERVGLETL